MNKPTYTSMAITEFVLSSNELASDKPASTVTVPDLPPPLNRLYCTRCGAEVHGKLCGCEEVGK